MTMDPDDQLDFEVTELHRRLSNLIRIGTIEQTDYSGDIPQCKVRIGGILTAYLPLLCLRAGPDQHSWLLEQDEQVLVLAPSGDLAQGVILGSIAQNKFPSLTHSEHVHRTQYADGAVIEYDRQSHHLKVILPEEGTAEWIVPGGLTVTGDVLVNGSITATDTITDQTRSMQGDRDIYNGHTHSGIEPGSASSDSPNPNK